MSIASLRGWFLDRAVEIDAEVLGFAGHVLRSSPERRQVLAAYMSLDRPRDGRNEPADVGDFLLKARHDQVLEAAFGSRAPGLRAALRRAGPQPHKRRFYSYLYGLLTSPSRPEFARLIRTLREIDPQGLSVLRALPVDLRCGSLISSLENLRDARDLGKLVEVLTEHGADRCAMSEALRRVESRTALARFARRWSLRARLPAHPVPSSESYVPVTTAADLQSLAKRYRNCAANYISNALEGRSSFAEFVHDEGRAVVHILRLNGEWRLDRCYGRGNGPVPQAVRSAVRDYVKSYGVEQREPRSERNGKWEPLRRLAGYFDYEENE